MPPGKFYLSAIRLDGRALGRGWWGFFGAGLLLGVIVVAGTGAVIGGMVWGLQLRAWCELPAVGKACEDGGDSSFFAIFRSLWGNLAFELLRWCSMPNRRCLE